MCPGKKKEQKGTSKKSRCKPWNKKLKGASCPLARTCDNEIEGCLCCLDIWFCQSRLSIRMMHFARLGPALRQFDIQSMKPRMRARVCSTRFDCLFCCRLVLFSLAPLWSCKLTDFESGLSSLPIRYPINEAADAGAHVFNSIRLFVLLSTRFVALGSSPCKRQSLTCQSSRYRQVPLNKSQPCSFKQFLTRNTRASI
jgi:hypothetical protein